MSQPKQAILFLVSWYPTPQNKSHGIFIQNHALALSKFMPVIVLYAYTSTGVTKPTLTKNKEGDLEEWRVEYPKTSVAPLLNSAIKLLRFKKAYSLLLNELIKEKISVKAIQLNAVFPAAMALKLFKSRFKVPHTIVEHWTGYLPEDGNYKGSLIKHYTKKVVSTAAKIFYVSEKQKQAMETHGLKGNYQLLYNVVDTSVFNRKNVSFTQKPLLLHVSSLDEPQKNINGILNVIAQLQKNKYDFDVVFIGGNKESGDFFSRKAAELKLKQVEFVGPKTPMQISEYMQKAKALILFSNYENMPVVVLEAFACGLPVFTSNVGHLPHLVTDELGRIVEISDEKELQKNLEDLLNGKLQFDPEKMVEFTVQNASQQVVGKKLADFYNSI